jgi:iron complex transport system substrate-binding protein
VLALPVLAALTLTAAAAGCSKKAPSEGSAAVERPSAPPLVLEAEHFNVEVLGGEVRVLTDYDGRRLLLVPEGTDAAEASRLLAETGRSADAVIGVPVKRAFFTSATQAALLDALGDESLWDSAAAVTVPEADWTIGSVASRLRDGRTAYIEQSAYGTLDIEAVIALGPDIIFAGPGAAGMADTSAMFDAARLPYAVVGEWLEASSTARFEWLKFIAAFYGRDAEADAAYRRVTANMEAVALRLAAIHAAERPLVAYGHIYEGAAYTQGGASATAREFERAGARYFLDADSGGGTLRLTAEDFFAKARNADILMYVSLQSYTPNVNALLGDSPLFAEFKAVRDGRVYILADGYYMNDAKPDIRFADRAAIFHPALFPERQLTFYERLAD